MHWAASALRLGSDPGERAWGSPGPAPPGCGREPVACNIWKPFLSGFAARLTCGEGRAAPRPRREEAERNQTGSDSPWDSLYCEEIKGGWKAAHAGREVSRVTANMAEPLVLAEPRGCTLSTGYVTRAAFVLPKS